MPILDNDEDENKIINAMEQVFYFVHAEPDDREDKDDKNTGKDDVSDGHDDRYDNKDPDEIGGQPQPIIYIQYIYDIYLHPDADKR